MRRGSVAPAERSRRAALGVCLHATSGLSWRRMASRAGGLSGPKTLTRDNEDIESEAANDPGFYYTDAISDNAARFIREHHATSPDKPFFAYVAYTARHWPFQARPRDIRKAGLDGRNEGLSRSATQRRGDTAGGDPVAAGPRRRGG